jgi:hypothetical protein
MSVFFRKMNINASTGSATLIVTSRPISSRTTTLAGMKVATRTQSNVTFGVLSLIDPETNTVMKAVHPMIKEMQKKLEPGQEMEGFKMSDSPVMDLTTGEATTLFWVEAV